MVGAYPTDKCLGAANSSIGGDLGLVLQRELMVVEGAVQVLGDQQAVLTVLAVSGQVAVVEVRKADSGSLGGIHGEVGTAHQIHPAVGMLWRHGDTGGEADVQSHRVSEL